MTAKNEQDWLAERKTLIGASETPSILGCGYETAADVWARKVGHEVDADESERLEIGNIIQPAIIELARRRIPCFRILDEPLGVRRSRMIPYIGASLDAVVQPEEDPGFDVPLDVKNVDGFKAREWATEPPLGYQIQLQQQMFVTGATYGYLFALIGGNRTVWHRVERNDKFIAAMLKKLEWFWRLVQTNTPPPYEDPCDQARALATLYPQGAGTAIELDEVATRIVQRRDSLDSLITDAESKKLEAENELKAMLGENTYGALPDGRWVSWKQQTVKEHVRKASTFRALRYHDKRPKDAPALTSDAVTFPGLECDDMPPESSNVDRTIEIESELLGIGAMIRHRSDSGSFYYVLPGGLNVRISDHEPNMKTAAWMERNPTMSVRIDQDDWQDQLASVTGNRIATLTSTT